MFHSEVLGEYRIHGANASKVIQRNMEAELAVIERHFALGAERGFMEAAQAPHPARTGLLRRRGAVSRPVAITAQRWCVSGRHSNARR